MSLQESTWFPHILNNTFSKPFPNSSNVFHPISRPIAILLCNDETLKPVCYQCTNTDWSEFTGVNPGFALCDRTL